MSLRAADMHYRYQVQVGVWPLRVNRGPQFVRFLNAIECAKDTAQRLPWWAFTRIRVVELTLVAQEYGPVITRRRVVLKDWKMGW